MSAPLTPPTPPHDESSHGGSGGAWHKPTGTGHGGPQDAGQGPGLPAHPAPLEHTDPDGPELRTEIREAAVVLAVLAVCGVLLGALWSWLAPRLPLVGDVVDDRWVVYVRDTEGEQAIGVDGTFTLLALGFGAVTALAAFLWRRRGGVPQVLALGLGGLVASFVAWRVGMWLGPPDDVLAQAKAAGQGGTFSAPLELGAKAALLAWPVAALLVHLGLTALFAPRDEEPPPPVL
ncbi:AAA family ATPase [Streptomyces sp. NPDC091377]|uniref:AAA family ATPase n=1 Tax=unclassified Streptomyces TaxID=2593676 RepID=UPI0037F82537